MKFLHLGLASLLFPLSLFGGFSVSPLILNYDAGPGESQTLPIEISNGEDRVMAVELYIRDFHMEESGQEIELEVGSHPHGCGKNLELYPSGTVYLQPHEKRLVQLRLSTPEDASGSFWTKVYVGQVTRPKPIEQKAGETRVQIFIKERWEVRLHHVVSGHAEKSGSIVDMHMEEGKIALQFENSGSEILRCRGRLEIKSLSGEALETIFMAGNGFFTVYPESTRTVLENINKDLEPGDYVALAIIDFGSDELIAGELEFTIK